MLPAVADQAASASGTSASGTSAPGTGTPAAQVGDSGPETVPIRPLTWRELADLPFAVLQRQIRLLAAFAGLGFASAVAAVLAVTALTSLATGGASAPDAWAAVLTTVVCVWLLRWWTTGVTVTIGLAVVNRQPIGARAVLGRLRAVLPPLVAHQLVVTGTGLGLLILGSPLIITLIPALILLARLRGQRWTVPSVLVGESAPYAGAVLRAKLLSTGREMPLAGLWIALRLVPALFIAPIAGLAMLLSDISGTHRWAVTGLLCGVALLLATCAAAVEAAAGVVVYIDRRCRREGLDIRIPGGFRGSGGFQGVGR
ncbi:MAG: hypothetical protein J2P18_09395 [Nocardia sp.]|nr:hypothetical protein [Nocardia sp.]